MRVAAAVARASRRPRSTAVDLQDADAKFVLAEHVVVASCTNSKEALFRYRKDKHGQGAAWEDIWKHRLLLTDLIEKTDDNFLKMQRWETHVGKFLRDVGKLSVSVDDVTAVARRPRLMLSHLWNAKRRGSPIPHRFAQLAHLRDSMNVTAKAMLTGADLGDEQDDVDNSCFESDSDDDDDDVAMLQFSQVSHASAVTIASFAADTWSGAAVSPI